MKESHLYKNTQQQIVFSFFYFCYCVPVPKLGLTVQWVSELITD